MEKTTSYLALIPFLFIFTTIFLTRNPTIAGLVGLIVSNIIIWKGNIFKGIFFTFSDSIPTTLSDDSNTKVIMFTVLINAFITVLIELNLFEAISIYMRSKIKSYRGALFVTFFLCALIFFDDYSTIFIVGSIAGNAFSVFGLRTESFSYIVHALSSPKAMFMPISSYASVVFPAVGKFVEKEKVFETLLSSLCFQFFSIFTFLILFVTLLLDKELIFLFISKNNLNDNNNKKKVTELKDKEIERNDIKKKISLYEIMKPIILFSVFFFSIIISFFMTSESLHSIDSNVALLYASSFSLFFSLLFLRIPLSKFNTIFLESCKDILSCLFIVILYSALGDAMDKLKVSFIFSSFLTSLKISEALFPLIIFIFASVVSVLMGSSWASINVLSEAIKDSVISLKSKNKVLFYGSVGALLSGSIVGDFLSFYSDTAVLTSATMKIDSLVHLKNIILYGILAILVSIVFGYSLVVFNIAWLSLLIGSVIVVLVIHFFGTKRENLKILKVK